VTDTTVPLILVVFVVVELIVEVWAIAADPKASESKHAAILE